MTLWRSPGNPLDVLRNPGQYRDTLFLVSATIFSAVGSLIYWKLITYRFEPTVMGLTSTAISSAVFLGSQANIGLTIALLRFMPEQLNRSGKLAMVSFTYATGLCASFLFGAIFLAGRFDWAPDLVPPEAGWIYLIIFMSLLVSYCVTNVNVAVLQAEMRTPYLLLQSTLINIIQITGGWFVSVRLGVTGVLFTYTLPIIVAAMVFFFLIRRMINTENIRPDFGLIPYVDLIKFSFGNLIFSLIWSIPSFIFPLIILEKLGAEAAALLAITWYGFTFVAIIPQAAVSNLMVYGSQEPDWLGPRLWRALRVNFLLLIPIILFIVVFAPWLLLFFGPIYSQAAQLLCLLTISCIPLSVNSLYLSMRRIRKEIIPANLLILTLTIVNVFCSYVLVNFFQLNGIGWGWLLGQTIFALIFFPLLLKEKRGIPE